MRRLIAVAVLAAVIAAVCVVGQSVISECGKTVGPLLLDGIAAAEVGDVETAREKATLAETSFLERESKLDFFLHHDLVENLGTQLAKLKGDAEEESLSDYRAEAYSAVAMLTHVVNDERPTFLNIF